MTRQRTQNVTISVSEELKKQIDEDAEANCLSSSAFMRQLYLKYREAKREAANEHEKLTAEDRQRLAVIRAEEDDLLKRLAEL